MKQQYRALIHFNNSKPLECVARLDAIQTWVQEQGITLNTKPHKSANRENGDHVVIYAYLFDNRDHALLFKLTFGGTQ